MSIIREVHAVGPRRDETRACDNPFIAALSKARYIETQWQAMRELNNLAMYQRWLDCCLIIATHIEGVNGDDEQWREFVARYDEVTQ